MRLRRGMFISTTRHPCSWLKRPLSSILYMSYLLCEVALASYGLQAKYMKILLLLSRRVGTLSRAGDFMTN